MTLGGFMRRLSVVSVAVVTLLIPASLAVIGLAGTASAASSVACSKTTGKESGSVTITDCTPSAGKSYKKATVPALDLAEGGTITWNGGATTTIGDPDSSGGTGQGTCKKKNLEYFFSGVVTAASTSGAGIPAVGDAVSASACLSSSGKISLAPGTVLEL
jgi:hypothetical protein